MNVNDPEELVETFARVLGTDGESSRFFLEAGNWDLQAAVCSVRSFPPLAAWRRSCFAVLPTQPSCDFCTRWSSAAEGKTVRSFSTRSAAAAT